MTDDVCGRCGEPYPPSARYCESCGHRVAGIAGATDSPGTAEHGTAEHGTTGPGSGATAPACRDCAGPVAADGYCLQCGGREADPRDHWSDEPAPGTGGVCDRGVRHTRNEDAMALYAAPDVRVLVVCDGVSSAPDSDRASLAAAVAARDHLAAVARTEPAAELDAGWSEALVAAVALAEQAVLDGVGEMAERREPPSCTFVASVVTATRVTTAWLGDSRAYWVPDDGPAQPLSTDDSWVEEMVAQGMARADAVASPHAHAITRWIGPDSGDAPPRVVETPLDTPGWVVLCSDGLWNYCPDVEAFTAVVREAVLGTEGGGTAGGGTAVAVADRLVRWATEQGGADNITVALARHPEPGAAPSDNLPLDASDPKEL
ncbi:protein phosphatase 2C domain-containing protein [Cellulomonas sp. PhB143]|uniref:protein phosphatase 2C domain-containing protein n=1 Tax=Cellulomonas sp. PhB143 TaxID=2485186 RepID=UPI000F480D7F|nr:protein phosphatase 2C domain-containing protein [Cellulomonas sp. PhB143]ROS77035.1 serine/threonine protein phosphatase PrpC [Cellulomonas sp. PhB143]